MVEKKLTDKAFFNNSFFAAIILLIFIKPAYFSHIQLFGKFYKYAEIFITSLMLFYSFFCKKKTFSTIWYYLFFGIMLLSTVLNNKSLYDFSNGILSTIGLCVFFDLYIKKNPKTLFKAFTILELYIIINFITIILFPTGMYKSGVYYENWFLGYKNIQIRTILPIICISIINSYMRFDRLNLKTKVLLVICIITFILTKSSTALVGFFIFLILFLKYHDNKPLPKILNIKFAILTTSILFSMISILKLQNLFKFFIVDILNKDITFSGRIIVWDKAINFISAKPIIGYGYTTGEQFQTIFNSIFFTHPHNYYLYILMTGGLLLLAIIIIGLLHVDKAISKSENSKYGKVILFTIISFLIMGITESITSTVLLYPIIILGMNSDKINNL